jgi:hypothetical protein
MVVDASSGSTAISEAWFARLLGLRFVAVMPACTAPAKIEAVRALGGRCELTAEGECTQARARHIAADGGCFLDQFGLAERATDWRGNNNIAESILGQLQREPHPQPTWIVCGAGTGGTSATIGRYLRYRGLDTGLCVADPEGAAFAAGWRNRDRHARARQPTCIEGIGRSQVEPGFLFEVVDEVVEVPDPASVAAMLLLTLRGTPTLYQGDEIGIGRVDIPPDRIRDPQHFRQPTLNIGRDRSRTPMPWDTSANAGFSTGDPWLPLNADWPTRNVAAQVGDPASMLTLYRRLLALRRATPDLALGDMALLDGPAGVLAYHRGAVTVLLNLTDVPIDCVWEGTPLLSTLYGDPTPGVLRPNEGLIVA